MCYKNWIIALIAMTFGLKMLAAEASYQADIELLGVSPDLSQIGTVQTWTDEADNISHCQVEVYQQQTWKPVLVKQMSEASSTLPFETQCKHFASDTTAAYHLQIIKWKLAVMAENAPKIKDQNDDLIPQLSFLKTHYPKTQQFNFTLRPGDQWQVYIQADGTPDFQDFQKSLPYIMVLRPSLEPVPYLVLKNTYQPPEVLVTPIKIMLNEYYGLAAVIFRETELGKTDVNYKYRPLFIKWPNYQAMTEDDARSMLLKTTEYAMEPSQLIQGPNTLHPAYRAFLRLKAQHLALEDLKAGFNEASLAGKLYWLLLIEDKNPEVAKQLRSELLKDTQPSEAVIQVSGEQWESLSFKSVLEKQAH